jgi:hypothetical protein
MCQKHLTLERASDVYSYRLCMYHIVKSKFLYFVAWSKVALFASIVYKRDAWIIMVGLVSSGDIFTAARAVYKLDVLYCNYVLFM